MNIRLAGAAGTCVVVASTAASQGVPFSDDFDSYNAGQGLVAQADPADWQPWCFPPGPDGLISNAFARSAPNSFRVNAADGTQDDVVHRMNVDAGQWTIEVWTFVPNGGQGVAYVILLNQYFDENCLGQNNWSLQVRLDGFSGQVNNEGASGGFTTLVRGQWMPVRVEVDLDADLFDLFYGNVQLVDDGVWSEEASGGGIPALAALDLFCIDSELFFDDVSIRASDGGGPLCMTAGDWTNNSSETGTVANTCESDDARTAARRATFTPAATALLRYDASTVFSGLGGASTLTVTAECGISNAGVSNVTGRLQIRNQTSGAFVNVSSGLLTTSDAVLSGNPTGDPNLYIGANGLIEVRVIFQQTSGGPNWDGRIDQLVVDVQ
jgi:hypothetical protein